MIISLLFFFGLFSTWNRVLPQRNAGWTSPVSLGRRRTQEGNPGIACGQALNAKIEQHHEKSSSHDSTAMDCFKVFRWNQVAFQEVELSTLTLECLNRSGCHTFQLDLCLLGALWQEQGLLRSFQHMYYKLCKSVVRLSNMRWNLATEIQSTTSYLLRCRSTGFRLFLESAHSEKRWKFIWPSSIWPRVGFNGSSCINVRCMLVSKFSRTIWLCIWGQGDRDPLKKSNQTCPIFLAGSNIHMESLPPRSTD